MPKKTSKPSKDEEFKNALENKNIPILTLDNKWHKLFSQADITPRISALEERMNALLKRQGKVNTESKKIKKLKKKLLDEIVLIADDLLHNPDSKKLSKDMDEHKRLVEECNEKLDAYEAEMLELPREMDQTNRELMLASMEVCYRKIQSNEKEIAFMNDWIENTRRELKKKMVRKEEKETINSQLYSYMHDIFGADVIEIFDMKYNPENNPEGAHKQERKKSKKG